MLLDNVSLIIDYASRLTPDDTFLITHSSSRVPHPTVLTSRPAEAMLGGISAVSNHHSVQFVTTEDYQ
jgi:hypothetical protein